MPNGDRRCPSCSRSFGAEVLFCPTDGAPLVPRSFTGAEEAGPDPYVGLSLLGQIEIRRLTGVGSMARVYRAFQHTIERDVAVKILHRELSSNPEIVERFHREAKVASRLAHPNVVQVLLTATLPPTGKEVGGELVLVMEYLDGMSLLSALGASGGVLSLPRALHVVLQICDAVGEAHSQTVVHRDLKPENVMLVRRGDDPDFVKVLDFGLARLSTRDASYATRAGAIFGSPRYISPEGAQGLPVGPQADVYAIATLLYQCLAGRTPFEADTAVGFLLAHANERPSRVTDHPRGAHVPDAIAELLDQSLSKRPEDRPADARAFGRALIDAARRCGLLSESGAAPWPAGRGSGNPGSLARPRGLKLTPVFATDLGQPLSTGTLSAPLEELDFSPAPPVAPTPARAATPTPPPALGAITATYSAPSPGVAPTLFDAPVPRAPEGDGQRPARSPTHHDGENDGGALHGAPSAAGDEARSPAPGAARSPTQHDAAPAGAGPPPLPPTTLSLPSPAPPPAAALPSAAPPAAEGGHWVTTPPPSAAEARRAVTVPGASLSGSVALLPDTAARSAWSTAALVALCFACGAALAFVGATRLGIMQSRPPLSRADAMLAEADEATGRQDWDRPPVRNVRDLLTRGRAEFPMDERFAIAQKRASVDVTMQAAKERSAGRNDEALRLSRLALELDPTNALASTMLRELGPAPEPPAPLAPSPTPPPLRVTGARPPLPPAPGAAAPPPQTTPPEPKTPPGSGTPPASTNGWL